MGQLTESGADEFPRHNGVLPASPSLVGEPSHLAQMGEATRTPRIATGLNGWPLHENWESETIIEAWRRGMSRKPRVCAARPPR